MTCLCESSNSKESFKSLDVELLSSMSFDSIIKMYKNGYRLDEFDVEKTHNVQFLNKSNTLIKKMSLCQSSFELDTNHTFYIEASSGTPPYIYNWLVLKPDNSIEKLENKQALTYKFTQLGTYNISVNITDSCLSGGLISETQSCSVTVVPVVVNKYNCVNGSCVQDNLNGIFFEPTCNNSCLTENKCLNCDLSKNYCISGKCISKNNITYGGLGILLLLLIL